MLSKLPVEIALQTFTYLSLTSIVGLRLVSQQWKAFLDENEENIFHHAAVFHGYIPSVAISFVELGSLYSARYLEQVTSWKAFCQRVIDVSRSWSGRGPSIITQHSMDTRVHRFKIDEIAGYAIHTSSIGSLTVSDLSTGKTLWSINHFLRHVRPFAHCEYGEGYIIFDRLDSFKEVWRRASDFDDSTVVPGASPPDILQLQTSSDAWRASCTDNRGHFRPWALLRSPAPTRAYRFVYPTLLVSGAEAAFLWDIPSATLVQTIEHIQSDIPAQMSAIRYVELSSRHVFICLSDCLRIFSRANGACVLQIPSWEAVYGDWAFSVQPTPYFAENETNSALFSLNVEKGRVVEQEDARPVLDTFVAAHVSSCGCNLVCLLSTSRVIIIYGFERAISGSTTIREISLDVQLGTPRYASIYLAFENDSIGVATAAGVFVLQTRFDSDGDPRVRIGRLPTFASLDYLPSISCLQMTRTGLFLNWPVHSWDSEDLEDGMEWFNDSLNESGLYHEQGGALIPVFLPQFDLQPSSAIYDVNFARPLYDQHAYEADLSRQSTS